MEDLTALFVSIGLSEIKAKETIKNANVSAHLKNCIDLVSDSLSFGKFTFIYITWSFKNTYRDQLVLLEAWRKPRDYSSTI